MEKNDKVYVYHILDAIETIQDFLKDVKTVDEFLKPEQKKTQDAVVRELEIIGEAAKQLTELFRSKISELPWNKITAMRNKLSHEYWDVDLRIVWKTVMDHLDPLKQALQEYLRTNE